MRKTAPLLAAVLTTLAVSQVYAADLPGKGITVKPAQSTITEEGFQTLLVSCALGWGCEAVINHQNTAFDLSDTVTANMGNYSAMVADTLARFKQGKPILYYT